MPLKLIKTIQDVKTVKSFFYDVFPEEPNYDCQDFIDSVTGHHQYKRLEYYFYQVGSKVVGFCGIYSKSNDEC